MTFEEIVDTFIKGQIPEGVKLDYKAGRGLDPNRTKGEKEKFNRDLPKDVSAFANTEGGKIIIGIAENKLSPLTPYFEDLVEFAWISRDTLDQLIGNAHPRVKVAIEFAPHPIDPNRGFIILDVEESHTVHQAPDYIYYMRNGAANAPMPHSLVKAVMEKTRHTKLEISLSLAQTKGEHFNLRGALWNPGPVMVNYFMANLVLPQQFRSEGRDMICRFLSMGTISQKFGENKKVSLIKTKDISHWEMWYNSSKEPLFPSGGITFQFGCTIAHDVQSTSFNPTDRCMVQMNADSAPRQIFGFSMADFFSKKCWESNPENGLKIAELPYQ